MTLRIFLHNLYTSGDKTPVSGDISDFKEEKRPGNPYPTG